MVSEFLLIRVKELLTYPDSRVLILVGRRQHGWGIIIWGLDLLIGFIDVVLGLADNTVLREGVDGVAVSRLLVLSLADNTVLRVGVLCRKVNILKLKQGCILIFV